MEDLAHKSNKLLIFLFAKLLIFVLPLMLDPEELGKGAVPQYEANFRQQ
jgi:hypothetical protein